MLKNQKSIKLTNDEFRYSVYSSFGRRGLHIYRQRERERGELKVSFYAEANKLKVTLKITPRRRWLMKPVNNPMLFASAMTPSSPFPSTNPYPLSPFQSLQLQNGNKILFSTK